MISVIRRIPSAALALLVLAAAAPPAHAAIFTPSKTTDGADGACNADCSLRDAVNAANALPGPDVILLPPGTYTLSLAGAGEDQGATGDLDIRGDLAIVGSGADDTLVDGGDLDRVFDVKGDFKLEIVDLTVRNGRVEGSGGGIRNEGDLVLTRSVVTGNETTGNGNGGGIASESSGGTVEIVQSTVAANIAHGSGGGFYGRGSSTITNSTFSGNSAAHGFGGGLYFLAGGAAEIVNVTIASNSAAQKGGGIYAESSAFTSVDHPALRNSVLAGNTAPMEAECSGAVVSAGHNLLRDATGCLAFSNGGGNQTGTTQSPLDARLSPLGVFGGTTPTHVPLEGSPVLDAGAACEPVDQRGAARPDDGVCDAGAVEQTSRCLTGGNILCLNGDRFRVEATWKVPNTSQGNGQAVKLTSDTGYFWFFDPTNVELTLKVLDGCGVNGRYWVFVSGLTNVEVRMTVTDTATGKVKTYTNAAGRTFPTVLDTNAFATCP